MILLNIGCGGNLLISRFDDKFFKESDFLTVTVSDLAFFVQSVSFGFSDTLFFAFTLMLAFSVLYGIKKLVVD